MFPFTLPPRYTFNGQRLEGGQGYVYVCHDTYLDRPVAIKVMKKVSDADLLRKELAALRDVRSPHIAEVYDLLTAKRSAMAGLVQEFVPGASLADLASNDLTPNQLLRILWQISKGIADIHAHKKVHRDIKPTNIRFDAEGIAKILDFGLTTEAVQDAETVNARGTKYYAAPELYGQLPIKVTPAMDSYSFGVTAWFLAAKGRLPKALREAPPGSQSAMPSFMQFQVQMPPTVCKVLDLTLSIDPPKRPKMDLVRQILEMFMLYGRHRASVRYGAAVKDLATPGDSLNLAAGGDSVVITYDGLTFRVQSVVGDVYVNNAVAVPNSALPGSCVITLGNLGLGWSRTFVPIDMSHPEVVL